MKVLIAVDDSLCSHEAVSVVANRPWAEGTQFKIVHVVEPIAAQYGLVAPEAVNLMIEAEKKLKAYGVKFTTDIGDYLKEIFGEQQVSSVVIGGYIADSIIELASDWHADVIVVGSHGRTGLDKILLGSVAEKIVNRSHCSVEVIKMKIKKNDDTSSKDDGSTALAKQKQAV